MDEIVGARKSTLTILYIKMYVTFGFIGLVSFTCSLVILSEYEISQLSIKRCRGSFRVHVVSHGLLKGRLIKRIFLSSFV